MAASNRKNSGRVIILVAVVLILILAVAAVFFWSQNLLKPQTSDEVTPVQPQSTMTDIVVIAQPVTRGTALTESVLTMIPYPQDKLVEGLFFTSFEDVIDKKAKFDLPQGMPLTSSVLTEGLAGSYAAFQIPQGMVGISIPVTRLTSMAYGLQSGDAVNVITSLMLVDMDADFQTKLPNNSSEVVLPGVNADGVVTASSGITTGGDLSREGRTELDVTLNQPIYVVPAEAQRPRLVSQTLVYNATILWMGDFPADGNISSATTTTATTTDETTGEETTTAVRPDMITVIVTPQDAVTINYLLLADAKFNFVLRGAGDTDKSPTQAVTLQFVMDQYGIPYPSKLPYGVEPRQDEMLYPGEGSTVQQP